MTLSRSSIAEISARICAASARFALSCGGSADAVEARLAAAATSTTHHRRRPQRRLPTTPKCSTSIAGDLFASRLTTEPRRFQANRRARLSRTPRPGSHRRRTSFRLRATRGERQPSPAIEGRHSAPARVSFCPRGPARGRRARRPRALVTFLRYEVMRVGPLTVLPAACTEPVSGGGSVPVVPEIVSGPPTTLSLTSTPPWLSVSPTGAEIVLPAQGPVAASPPTSTRLVLPVTDSGPDTVLPQILTTVAPVARTGPDTIAPARSIAPPGFTVIGPFSCAPGSVQNAWPAAIVSGPLCVPVRHGLVEVTLSVPATNGPKL